MQADAQAIKGAVADHYQDRVEQVYSDLPELWQHAIGPGLWFQFGVYDPASLDPQSLDDAGRRYLDRQLEIAGLWPGSPTVQRILDVGCGWGAPLEHLARRFPHCPRIDGINIVEAQLAYTALRLASSGAAGDRVHLYRCNARDIALLPEPDRPYDLILMRGCITHFSPETVHATLRALSSRAHAATLLIISENLHNTPLETYSSALKDEVDRLACGHQKTRDFLLDALRQHSFSVRDIRTLPSNQDSIRWLSDIKANIDRHFTDGAPKPLEELRDVAENWSAALRDDTVSVYSIVARPVAAAEVPEGRRPPASRRTDPERLSPADVPPVWCPIPTEIHPGAAVLDERTAAWLDVHGLGMDASHDSLLSLAGYGTLAALWYPNLPDLEHGQIAADFCAWISALDDFLDVPGRPVKEAVGLLNSLLRLLDAPGSPPLDDHPLSLALAELVIRMTRHASPAQLRRFATAVRTYADATIWDLAGGIAPNLNQYTALRLHLVAGATITGLYEIVHGYRLKDEELAAPRVRALTEMSWLLSAWDNDLYSWPKELHTGVRENNLVALLAGQRGWEWGRAMSEAVHMRNNVMAHFMRLRAQVGEEASVPLRSYLHDLGMFIAGSTLCYRACPRYTHGVDAGDLLATPPVTLTDPRGAGHGFPLALETVAWWWD